MSIKRWDARRDGNEGAIIEALRRAGAMVLQLDVVDLAVYFAGRIYLLEVKTATGQLTKAQKDLLNAGWPIIIVRSPEAALAAIGAE